MEYELENAFSDIEEDENDAPLNVVPFLEEQNLREWVPVKVGTIQMQKWISRLLVYVETCCIQRQI